MRSPACMSSSRLGWFLTLVGCLALLGCDPGGSSEEIAPPDYSRLVPVTGTVRLNGKAVPGAVVTFLPAQWAPSNGETDAKGSYTLQTAGRPGSLPGDYKVAVSYLVSTDGEPFGLAPRSALVPPMSLASAKEKVHPKFSDLGRTTLKATIPAGGGNFDFDVEADLESPAGENSTTSPKAAESQAKNKQP